MESIRLSTIGCTELNGPDGRSILSVLSQPKRFALLVYLAVAAPGGFVRRDRLVALFWPEHDADRARANLSKGLSFLRKSLGPNVVLTRGDEEVGVAQRVLRCDVVELAEGGQAEASAWPNAVDGRFLDGFHFDGAPTEWGDWVEEIAKKVERLKEAAAGAADALDRSQSVAPVVGHISAAKTRSSVRAGGGTATTNPLEQLPADDPASSQQVVEALPDRLHQGETHGAVPGRSPGPWNPSTIGLTALSAGLVLALAVTLGVVALRTPEVVRFTVPLGQDADTYLGIGLAGRSSHTSVALSPDGHLLVYAGVKDVEELRLYQRALDQERAEPIEGTEGAAFPFFSPDGAWLGFFRDGSLWRISMADGDVQRITESWASAATWGDDGTIVFANGGLYRVAATGGEPESLTGESPGASINASYYQPHMLPGSAVVLSHLRRSPSAHRAEIVALDLTTGAQKLILPNATDPRYVETGHLLFMRRGTLMAVAFDPGRLEVQGQPVSLIEDVMHALHMPNSNLNTGAAQVAVSVSGHLAYARGGVFPEQHSTAVRITDTGDTLELGMEGREYINLRVSPDGDDIAFAVRPRGGQNIAWHDLTNDQTHQLSNRAFLDNLPVWSPDGTALLFTTYIDERPTIFLRSADGDGEPERLTSSDQAQRAYSWSSQGVIAFGQLEEDLGEVDVWVLPPDGTATRFFAAPGMQLDATFSPDGQWLAYVTLRDGKREVSVRPYPAGKPATLISDNGSSPAWSPDSRRIYYEADNALMAVDVTPENGLRAGRPVPYIESWGPGYNPRGYDVHPDGSIVKMVVEDDRRVHEKFGATELQIVLNWVEELKKRVPN